MPIHPTDIKLLASKVMDDVPEGGGGPSGRVIASGASNQIFTDITSVDRAGGDVSLRQLHYHARTDDTERALDMYLMIARKPLDPAVDITLVECEPFATRAQIAQAVASYLIPASEWGGYLLENHIRNQQNITVLQRPGTTLPTVGRTFYLVRDEGLLTERKQAVRVTKVEGGDKAATFTDMSASPPVDFQALRITLSLDQRLLFDFPGSPPSRGFARQPGKTLIRDSMAASASRFFGTAKTTAASAITDDWVTVDSIHTQVVPSSRTPRNNPAERPGAQRAIVLATSPRRVEVGVTPHSRRIKIGSENVSASHTLVPLRPLPEPGTIVITYRALGQKYTLTDDGAGHLVGAVGESGALDYLTGLGNIRLAALPDVGSVITIHWGERTAFTDRRNQGAAVRAPEYAWVLDGAGVLEPGSLTISYPSGGVTRVCAVAADGAISGAGVGHVDNPSRTVQLRPSLMPDAGAQFACDYQLNSAVKEIIAAPTPDAGGYITLNLAQQPVAGTLRVAWATAQEVSQTSGASLHAESFAKNNAAAASSIGNSLVIAPWQQRAALHSDIAGGGGGGGVSGVETGFSVGAPAGSTAGGTPLAQAQISSATDARSVYTTESAQTSVTRLITLHALTDNGQGGFGFGMGDANYAGKQLNLRVVTHGRGTSSYKADHENARQFSQAVETPHGGGGATSSSGTINKGGEYGTTGVADMMLAGSSVVVTYQVGVAQPVAFSMAFTPPQAVIDLCRHTTDRIVPGSVRFNWMGTVYEDIDGVIYRGGGASGAGIISGRMDYMAGLALMSDYVANGPPGNFTLQSLWTQKGDWRCASIFAQTQSSPIQPGPGGFALLLTGVDGQAITATADADGNLIGEHVSGKLEFEHGELQAQFGDWVLDSALTAANKAEWWYDPAEAGAVHPGKVWRPWPVDPASLRMAYTSHDYLPLDEDIIRMPATTLPPDGRVPKFRVGDYVSIDDPRTLAEATHANGDTINVGRARLSVIELKGADGTPITSGYTADLDAGIVKVVDTTGWPARVVVEHWLSRLARIAEVRLDGRLRLNKPLGHVFPAGSTVSSVLMAGDQRARARRVFDQKTWDAITWRDERVGDSAAYRYNDTDFPITVTNRGALTERFAIVFRNNGIDFDCIGEHLGYVGAGNKNTLFAPINTRFGAPYFSMPAGGWGAANWTPGNVVFVHTVGAMASFALLRAVQPGEAPLALDYSFEIQCRYDIDRPPGA